MVSFLHDKTISADAEIRSVLWDALYIYMFSCLKKP